MQLLVKYVLEFSLPNELSNSPSFLFQNLPFLSITHPFYINLPSLSLQSLPIQCCLITAVGLLTNQYNSIISQQMFQNSYQNGTYFDLFDPKLAQDKLKLLYRTTNVNGNNKIFDKDLKTFVLEFLTPNGKMCLPKQQKKDLYLIQQYLIFQIYFYPGLSWNIELVISDLTKTKRRIILSPAANKTEIKPFFVKTPCSGYKQASWNNFVVDLYSYIEPFKGQTYRSLDAIYITGHFKVRRIYTSTSEPMESEGENESQEIKQINFLPKNFYFPVGVPYVTKVNRYDGEAYSQATYELTEPSTKNSSFLKPAKIKTATTNVKQTGKVETVKTEKIIKEKEKVEEVENKKIKDFLSNTNGELIGRKKKQEEKSESDTSQVIVEGIPKTAKSTEKYAKKKNLIKTQQIPPKARSSLDKNSITDKKTQDKSKTKAKLNPWRTNSKEVAGYTDNSQLQISKNQQRNVDTPQTVSLFKNNNNKFTQTKNQRFQGKSDQYSDSQYVQLSQKFSTLTDGKFFRNQLYNPNSNHLQNQLKQQQEQDEIEQNIEMQTNSMYSSVNRKQEQKPEKYIENIHESICDSLDRFQQPKRDKYEDLGRSSLYGFGEKLMKRFMNEVQRPYSPPLGERQITEQQVSQNFHHDEKEEVELVYDPVLNCYYDHKTHTYYQLKN